MVPNRSLLFEPIKIGPVTAPNRFYAVPHATGHGWAQPNGSIALRAMKAEGGWGVVCSQITEIGPDGDMGNHIMDRLWDDDHIAAHARQVEAIHEHGALAGIEIAHGGMRSRNFHSGLPVPGPITAPVLRPEVPIHARAMDKADIKAFREQHKAAARRAANAGFDIIYVYAAHDLALVSHFLSRRTNHRTDEYGGSFNNRLRLLREVLEDTLEVCEGRQAVALRFAVSEPDKAVGLTHDGEGRDVVEALAELPDLWDVNIAGWPQDSAPSRFTDEGFQLPFTDFVKSITSKPVVGVGRFTSPDLMVSLLKKGRLDLIGGARPSIADPFLPAKIRKGREDEIRECIGCNICVSMDGYGVPIRCTQNPTISEEWRRGWHPEIITGEGAKSHLIIGAGPAGLECAWTLARGGHKVTIAEARAEAGGRITREAALPGLGAWARVRDHRLYQISQRANVDLYLESAMAEGDLADFDVDSIALATGAVWRCDGVGSLQQTPLDLRGIEILTPDQIMDGETPSGARVAVYDDDHFYMASLIAEKLAATGKGVAYLTPLATIASWTDLTLEQDRIIQRFNELGVDMHPNAKLQADGGFTSTLTGTPLNARFDTLVLVGARAPVADLFDAQSGLPPITRIGDCDAPGIIQAAVLSGHAHARRLLGATPDARNFKREFVGAEALRI